MELVAALMKKWVVWYLLSSRYFQLNWSRELESVNIEHLAASIIAACWAGDVAWNAVAALGAALEFWCTPAGCAATHFLLHFRYSALWDCHNLRSLLDGWWLIFKVFVVVECSPSAITRARGGFVYTTIGGFVYC